MFSILLELLKDESGAVPLDLGVAAALVPLTAASTVRIASFVDDKIDSIFFDRKHGIDTAGAARRRGPRPRTADRQDGNRYMPTPARTLRSILSRLPVDLDEFVFVDLGSGKGRTMLVAAEFSFKEIVGVEMSPELVEVALRNVRAYRNVQQKCFDIDALCMDAADYEIPDDDCVFFMYNPFEGAVMERVVASIRRSYEHRPRRLYVIYYHPTKRGVLEELSFMRRIAPPKTNTDYFAIYESMAAP